MKELIFSAQLRLEDATWDGQAMTTEELATKLSDEMLSYTGYRPFRDVHRELVQQGSTKG